MSALRSVLLPLASLPLVACSSSSLGHVPESVVELYDMANPAGGMELELERDGELIAIEADVAVSQVPQHLVQKVNQMHPNALMQGAEREIAPGMELWELKFVSQGRNYELVFDEEGNVHETEMSLTWGEAPRSILSAADLALPGGVPISIELVTVGETKLYHVKKERDEARYKIVLDESAKVLRLVREQRAEIEIPLAH